MFFIVTYWWNAKFCFHECSGSLSNMSLTAIASSSFRTCMRDFFWLLPTDSPRTIEELAAKFVISRSRKNVRKFSHGGLYLRFFDCFFFFRRYSGREKLGLRVIIQPTNEHEGAHGILFLSFVNMNSTFDENVELYKSNICLSTHRTDFNPMAPRRDFFRHPEKNQGSNFVSVTYRPTDDIC